MNIKPYLPPYIYIYIRCFWKILKHTNTYSIIISRNYTINDILK